MTELVLLAVLAWPVGSAEEPSLDEALSETIQCFDHGRPLELLRLAGTGVFPFDDGKPALALLDALTPEQLEAIRQRAKEAGAQTADETMQFFLKQEELGETIRALACASLVDLEDSLELVHFSAPEIFREQVERGCLPKPAGELPGTSRLFVEAVSRPGELASPCRVVVAGDRGCPEVFRKTLEVSAMAVANNLDRSDGLSLAVWLYGISAEETLAAVGLPGKLPPEEGLVAVYQLKGGRYQSPKLVSPDELLVYIRGPACDPPDQQEGSPDLAAK